MSDRIAILHFQRQNKERLDVFLTECLPDYSRSRLQGLIKEGFVKVDGIIVTKAGQKLEPGAQIEARFPLAKPSGLVSEKIPLDIVFENDDLLVVNKPAGMVVHPSPGHDSGTLVHAVLGYVPQLEGVGGEERPGIVHRLDKDTSGLIVVAKNEQAHRWLQEQFKKRKVEKTYLALVDGTPPTATGRVEAPIGRNSTHRKLMSIVSSNRGREAITEYKIKEKFSQHTFIEVYPLTGRTHQIRVHMAFLGCPVVGDKVYGKRAPSIKLDRQFLHAYRLRITLPDEKIPRVFEAKLPVELISVLKSLKGEK